MKNKLTKEQFVALYAKPTEGKRFVTDMNHLKDYLIDYMEDQHENNS